MRVDIIEVRLDLFWGCIKFENDSVLYGPKGTVSTAYLYGEVCVLPGMVVVKDPCGIKVIIVRYNLGILFERQGSNRAASFYPSRIDSVTSSLSSGLALRWLQTARENPKPSRRIHPSDNVGLSSSVRYRDRVWRKKDE